jgi:hypothetical protein
MKREKVARAEILERDKKVILYLYRHENWVYTFEDEEGRVIKSFDVEEVEVPPGAVPEFGSNIEGYLRQFEDKLFPTPCIVFYEIEYKNVGNIEYEIGFMPLKDWYEKHLTYLTPELFNLLQEDFVAVAWQMLMQHYNESKEYRRLLGKERYILKELFGTVLMFVKMCLGDNREEGALRIAESLYGELFKNWLAETVEKLAEKL